MYDHEYPTCAKTFATICIYHSDLDPDAVTCTLGVPPSASHCRGDVRNPERPSPYKVGAWFLTSEDAVQSRDLRCHIDWLLVRVAGKQLAFEQLKAQGCQLVLNCYWVSAHRHSGPMVESAAMRQLAELGLQLAFDVYFDDEGV